MEGTPDDLARSWSENVDSTVFEGKTHPRSNFRKRRHQLTFWTLKLFLTVHACADDACHRAASFRDPKTSPRFAQHLFNAGVEMAEVDVAYQAGDGLVVMWKDHWVFCVKVQIFRALKSSSASQDAVVVDERAQRRQG